MDRIIKYSGLRNWSKASKEVLKMHIMPFYGSYLSPGGQMPFQILFFLQCTTSVKQNGQKSRLIRLMSCLISLKPECFITANTANVYAWRPLITQWLDHIFFPWFVIDHCIVPPLSLPSTNLSFGWFKNHLTISLNSVTIHSKKCQAGYKFEWRVHSQHSSPHLNGSSSFVPLKCTSCPHSNKAHQVHLWVNGIGMPSLQNSTQLPAENDRAGTNGL